MPQPHIAAKTMSVKLDLDTRARVENLAEARHRSAHWVMREAITQYVDREERRETFRQDTIKAWEEYQETGMHATATEVDNWLASWGTENEVPAPVCHKCFLRPARFETLNACASFCDPRTLLPPNAPQRRSSKQ